MLAQQDLLRGDSHGGHDTRYRRDTVRGVRSVPSPALPAHLSNSLADSLEDERTVADPNAAPDALRPYTPSTHAAGAFDVTTQAPSPVAETSHPGAVARTTAGGDKKKNLSNGMRLAIAIGGGAVAGTLLLTGLYFAIQRTNANQAQPQPTVNQVDVPPTYGRIAVSTIGGTCALRIDGVDRGALTTYDVVPGEHVVKCTLASGAVKEQRVQVSLGQTAKVTFTGP